MIYYMQLVSSIVKSIGYGTKMPENSVKISESQFHSGILGGTVNQLPTYDQDGNILTDADITLA